MSPVSVLSWLISSYWVVVDEEDLITLFGTHYGKWWSGNLVSFNQKIKLVSLSNGKLIRVPSKNFLGFNWNHHWPFVFTTSVQQKIQKLLSIIGLGQFSLGRTFRGGFSHEATFLSIYLRNLFSFSHDWIGCWWASGESWSFQLLAFRYCLLFSVKWIFNVTENLSPKHRLSFN